VPVLRFAADGTTWETLIADTRSSESYISDDRRLLAVARLPDAGPSPIEVWDLVSGKRIKRLDGHWNRVRQMSFSADGRRLASVGAQADAIKIWSLDDVVELNVPSTKSATQ
jgi:COMPASS component SWD3